MREQTAGAQSAASNLPVDPPQPMGLRGKQEGAKAIPVDPGALDPIGAPGEGDQLSHRTRLIHAIAGQAMRNAKPRPIAKGKVRSEGEQRVRRQCAR